MRLPTFDPGIARQMLPFGAATAFSSLVSIVLSHGEKLLLARLGQLSELAYYAIAFSVASILMMIPHAMAFAALPVFTRLLESAPGDSRIYDRLVRANLLGLIPVAVGLVIAIRPFLYYWAGPAFAAHSTTVFRILVVGFLFLGLREMPYQALVAAGRTGTIARIQLLLIVPYIPLAIVLVRYAGITGAALAWSMQTVADAIWTFIAARRLTGWRIEPLRGRWLIFAAAAVIVALPVLSGELVPGANGWKLLLDVACLGSYGLVVWFAVLAPDERAWLKDIVRGFVMRRPGRRNAVIAG